MSDTRDIPVISPVEGLEPRPKVSVVTACYNALSPLKDTVVSVASQTFPDVEHVIIDGGSSDGTAAYLADLPDGHRWLSEKDDGIAHAMNKGVALARGEWIVVLHAGDVFAGDTILADAMTRIRGSTDILVNGICYGDKNTAHAVHHQNPRQRLTFKALLHQGTLCQRQVFEEIGGFDTSFRIGMDYEFFLRARRNGCTFGSTDLILAHMDDGGVSSQRDWPSLRRRFAEERRAQGLHASGLLIRVVYALYWPPYLAYRRVRAMFSGGA